jgi:hypothetical protein
MNTALTAFLFFGGLIGVVLLGRFVRRHLPEHHLSADSKDAVKLAMGLVATMTALLLGLLISSAKGSYDTQRSEVIQMAAKVAFLDRVLILYGPESADTRARFHGAVSEAIRGMWPEEQGRLVESRSTVPGGDEVYFAIQRLSPRDDAQRNLKAQAATIAADLGQLHALLLAQSVASISKPLLIAVVSWLGILFLSFSLIAPPNATTGLALVAAAFSVTVAVFLILELDQPMGGMIRISSEPMRNALNFLGK